MKVILREEIKGFGGAGDIVEVKPGYARNYLVPRGFAYLANAANMKAYEKEQYLKARKQIENHRMAEEKKEELEKVSLTVAVKVGEDDRLYGSVTSNTISELLMEKGYEINHRKIRLDEPIKELGVFEIGIDLAPNIEAKIKLWVVKE